MKRKTKFPFKLLIAFLCVLIIFYVSCKNIKEGFGDVGPMALKPRQQQQQQQQQQPQQQPQQPPPRIKPILSLKKFKIRVSGPNVASKNEPKGYALNNGQVALVGAEDLTNYSLPPNPQLTTKDMGVLLPDITLFDTSRLIGGRLVLSYEGNDFVNTIIAVRKGRSPNEYMINFTGASEKETGKTSIAGTITTNDNCGCN